jgi:hypothetical protein
MSQIFDQATTFTGFSIKFSTPKTGNAAARRAPLADAEGAKLRIGAEGGNLYINFGDESVEVENGDFWVYLPEGAYDTIRCPANYTHIAVLTDADADWDVIFCGVR